MTEQVPPWLLVMRAITGMTEDPGSGDNPRILHMADAIGREYPHQADYASYYTGDDIAWCGLTVGYCMTLAGFEPVFGPTDTDRWMWAQSWANADYWDAEETEPRLGAVIVMSRDGGGHVTLMEAHDDGSFLKDGYYRGRGGNQSDMVNVSNQAKSSVIALMWPKYRTRPDIFTPEMMPQEIAWTQATLNLLEDANLELDGENGPMTREAITQYQHHNVLPVTGVADRRTVDAMLANLEGWNEGRYRTDGK